MNEFGLNCSLLIRKYLKQAKFLSWVAVRDTSPDLSPKKDTGYLVLIYHRLQYSGQRKKTLGMSLNAEYLELDLTPPDVLPGKIFDLIVDGNCLHCIIGEDRKTFLSNVYRLLKVNGIFFVFSKCSYSGEDEIIEFEGKPYRFVPSQEKLHSELEALGFEIKRSDLHRGREGDKYGHCTVHLT